jgi:signal transduction histidine kinase
VFATLLTVFLIIHKHRQNQAKLERQQSEFATKSSMMSSRIELQEQTLEFVSQEIHDNLGQVLSFSCMQLADIRNTVSEPELRTRLSNNLEVTRKAVRELRMLSHSLNGRLIEQRPLDEVVETELARIRSFCPMRCSLKVEGGDVDLPPESRLLIFRIVQEALQNVVKHAKAESVNIRMNYGPRLFSLQIEDDGKGLDADLANSSRSLGMTNMRQRARLLKGDLLVSSNGVKGTILTLNIPSR